MPITITITLDDEIAADVLDGLATATDPEKPRNAKAIEDDARATLVNFCLTQAKRRHYNNGNVYHAARHDRSKLASEREKGKQDCEAFVSRAASHPIAVEVK